MIKIKHKFLWRKRYKSYISMTNDDRRRKIINLALILMFVVAIHTIAMMWFERLSLWDSLWLTMTTITTVGYGDISARTLAGRTITILLMYIFGIFLLAQIAGEWIDYRLDRRDRMKRGFWRWNMKNHIVIINTPAQDGSRYLQVLVEQMRKSTNLEGYPIQIFSPAYPDGLPNELSALGVVLRQGTPEGRSRLDEADVGYAAYIIVLAVDAVDYRSDSYTLDVLDQLKEYDLPGYVIVECVQDENRKRLRQHGANAVIRPVRAYPELLVRALAAPGTEAILENLFQHQGVHSHRYDLHIPEQPWGQLVARLVLADLGTPMGYIDHEQQIVTHPRSKQKVGGSALFILVNHDCIPKQEQVQRLVAAVN